MINIDWKHSIEDDDFGGEPTGDVVDVYEARVGNLWIIVDEPHFGYGFRYRVDAPDYIGIAGRDGFASADAAKAAVARELPPLLGTAR